MSKLGVAFLAALAALVIVGRAPAQPAWAGQCGIPANQTVWADYSWSTLLPVMARPGTVLAVTNGDSGTDYSAQARALGAATYSFDIHLSRRVGAPDAPADPATIAAAAEAQYATAVARSGGCPSPLIVENELWGPTAVTPWSASNVQYRADVLAYLQDLARLGAHPVLLLATSAYLGSPEAVSWWLQVAKVADIVREAYISANPVWTFGPVLGNRMLRERYRAAVAPFLAIGIPASRLGIMVSVLSQKGGGGRSGLEPASAWFQVVKWYALSAKEIASELRLGSVFSWGWQQWNPKEADPTKPDAACVWLWARQNSLCDAQHVLGPGFDASRTEGQIVLPAQAFCEVPGYGTFKQAALRSLTAVTGDRNAALSILFERLVEAHYASVSSDTIRVVEREVVGESFGGSRAAYLAALAEAHLSLSAARAVLADEIRRAELEQKERVAPPKPAEILQFHGTYPQLLVRRIHVSPAAPWLGGQRDGYAISGTAPASVFSVPSRRTSSVETLLGQYRVRPARAPVALGSLPAGTVRAAITTSLESSARERAFERWTIGEQRSLLDVATCRADDLPEPAATDFAQFVPFVGVR